MPKRLIVVAGNIGAGKTSLAERIGSRLGWKSAFESVSDNPYLPDFYADMKSWSFHLQIFFLGHRASQYLEIANDPLSAILDRSIYEDAFIFARALYALNNLTERDYLRAPVEVLMNRIHSRGRSIESGITSDYLRLLETYYDDWMGAFDLCPVLTIRTDDLDFVHKPNHLDIVVQRIQDRLAGKEDLVFTN
jgi:deoxyadenosine/deoxycytidine kinase